MNQKEYNLLAKALTRWYKTYNVSFMQYDGLVEELADSLEVYKSFDRSKFVQACMRFKNGKS